MSRLNRTFTDLKFPKSKTSNNSGLKKLKDIERKINHIKEIVPEAKIEERNKILLRYFNRI